MVLLARLRGVDRLVGVYGGLARGALLSCSAGGRLCGLPAALTRIAGAVLGTIVNVIATSLAVVVATASVRPATVREGR